MKLGEMIRFLIPVLCMAVPVSAQSQKDELITIVETELEREMRELAKANQPPYYLSYRINDIQTSVISSSFGSLVGDHSNRQRTLVTDLRIGDYGLDNSHPTETFEEMMDFGFRGFGEVYLPIDNRPEAIQMEIWKSTQGFYRSALSAYKAVKSSDKSKLPSPADFSKEAPVKYIDPPLREISNIFPKENWVQKIKKLTEPFIGNPDIVDADASIDVGTERKYFISSEGSRIAQNRTYAYLTVRASIRSDDGDILPLHLSYFALEPGLLPDEATIMKDVGIMIGKLERLRTAPVAEPYTGPAILQARAAGVFFHEIFGHRVEGHRLKDKSDGQTFKAKVMEQVLPKSLSVISDPTLNSFQGEALNGHYLYDDEGVIGQKVRIVDNGILKTFLMSRSPIEGFPNSNGHGRAQAGLEAVSRQSNLIIENEKDVPMSELRKMLIKECLKEKKPYGYLFMDVVGGFTMTKRYMPNAFNIFPTEVYRIYADGRPDEMVRGVDLIGTPLAMFAEILAADNKREVFTGFCGAESGSVPVTAISPSLYVKRIETQKKTTRQVDKALLEKPHGN